MIFYDIKLFEKALVDNKRLMCFDIGDKKIGVAISDNSRTISNPHSVLIRKNIKKDFEIINNLIDNEFCGVILGFPLLMNGEKGQECLKIEKFAESLSTYLNIPIFLQDERLSTRSALKILEETNFTRKKKNNLDDKISASFILQIALDLIKNHKFTKELDSDSR